MSEEAMSTDLQTALVERACERLVVESAACNDRREWAALAALYTEDARLERPSGEVAEGREAIEAAYRAGPATRRSHHVCTNIRITVDGPSEAGGTTTVLLHRWTVGPGGEGAPDLPTYGPPAIGELHDRFVRTGAGWRIASRRAVLLARADQPATPGVDGSGGAAPGESL